MTIQCINNSFANFIESRDVESIKKQIKDCCVTNNYREIEYLLNPNRCTDNELIQILTPENTNGNEIPIFAAFNVRNMEALKSLLDISLKRGILDRVLDLKDNQNITLLNLLCYFGIDSDELNDWFCQFCPKESLSSALKIEGLPNFLPLFFAVQESKNETLKMFLRLCPEAIFFTNSIQQSLLRIIFLNGNYAAIECIEESLSSSEFKDYWAILANIKTVHGHNPFYGLICSLPFIEKHCLEDQRIEVLKKIESRIGRNAVLTLLSNASERGSIFYEGTANNWFKIVKYVLKYYPEIGKASFLDGRNIWHSLATISALTTDRSADEKAKIEFFKKYFSKELPSLNPENEDGITPLYIARYVSRFRDLANCYEKAGADAIAAHKLHYSKFLAHVWSIEQKKGYSLKCYPYLEHLTGWLENPSIVEMVSSFGCFLEGIDLEERSVYEEVFDQVNAALQAALSNDAKIIKHLMDQNKLWALPVSTDGHTGFLLGQGNDIILCDRGETILINLLSMKETRLAPGLRISELPAKLTEEQIHQLLFFEGDMNDFICFLIRDLNFVSKCLINLKKQPANTCAWTSAKTSLLAAFFIREMKNVKSKSQDNIEEDEIVYQKARFYYSKWSNFIRWSTLHKYKKIIERSNPLIEAVESKAILTFMIKFFKQNSVVFENDLKLNGLFNLHLFSKSSEKLDRLIHNFDKTRQRIFIIQTLYEAQNRMLNSTMDFFAVDHQLENIRYTHLRAENQPNK